MIENEEEILRQVTYHIDIPKFNELSKKLGNVPEDYYVTYKGQRARVFTREMDMILTWKSIPIVGENANLWKQGLFLRDYVIGFKDGEDWFINAQEKKKLFNIESREFIKNLYHLTYKAYPKQNTGFIYYIQTYPNAINPKIIYWFGYYSAFLNKVEELRNKNKKAFDKHFNDKP